MSVSPEKYWRETTCLTLREDFVSGVAVDVLSEYVEVVVGGGELGIYWWSVGFGFVFGPILAGLVL